jgi:sorbitol/mannitol transport system permease protein
MAVCQYDGQARDFPLFQAACTSDAFDFPPALIASREIAAGIDGRRILLQFGVDQADRFESLVEIQMRQSPQTAERLGRGNALLGLAFSFLLNRSFPLRGVARSLMIAPFFVMPTVNAVVQKNLFLNPIFGLLNWIMTSVGFSRIDWLAVHPKLSIIEMAVWQCAPFMMLILLAGLQGIPDDVREAARIDGAGPFTEFRRITIPLLGPYFQLAVLLGMIYILQLFGEIFVATQGGPGTATTTIPYYIYQTISQANDVGSSSAQGVLAIIFSSIIAALLLRLLLRTFRSGVTA